MAVYSSRNEDTFTDFIISSVEDNSVLQLSFPMRRIGDLKYYTLPEPIKSKGISFKWKNVSYNYQYVENAIDDFVDFYKSMAFDSKRIREAVDEYTKRVNSFYPEITFEELMKNVVNNHTVGIRRISYIK